MSQGKAPAATTGALAFLRRLSGTLRPLGDPAAIESAVGHLLGAHLGGSRVLCAYVSDDGAHLEVRRQLAAAAIPGPLPMAEYGRGLLARVVAGEHVVIDDVDSAADLDAAERAACRALGISSLACAPFIERGRVVGILAVRHPVPRKWSADDVALIAETADRTWTALVQAEADPAVRAGEARLAAMVAQAPLGLAELDLEGRFLTVNDELCRLVGRSRAALLGGRFVDLTHPDEVAATLAALRDVAASGGPCVCDTRYVRPERQPISARSHLTRLEDAAGGPPRLLVVTAGVTAREGGEDERRGGPVVDSGTDHRDVSPRRAHAVAPPGHDLEAWVRERTEDLRRANASLEAAVHDSRTAEATIKALFTRLITVQEDERRRVARDVHDHLGQQITALRLAVEALRSSEAAEGARIDRVARLAEELDRSVDYLTADLRPASLDHLGLAAALAGLAEQCAERFGLVVDYDVSRAAGVRLSADAEANVYRIAQEALHNVVKHARARHVSVLLERRDGRLRLTVEDDGGGFETEADLVGEAGQGRRLGLIGMRERAALVGGELEIESSPGRGTTVFVRVPL